MNPTLSAVVISASSGIGEAICRSWAHRGWKIYGTYRHKSEAIRSMDGLGSFFECDLRKTESISQACEALQASCPSWDILVLAAGGLEPVGLFGEVNFDEWLAGIELNFLQQMRILHNLLPKRNLARENREPCVIFFAGGGSNSAVVSYSSYAVSKIAMTKMCEFLDGEIPDTRFVIIGPGWVKTKIHEATLKAGTQRAGDNYIKTLERIKNSQWVPIERVVDCCTWVATTSAKAVRGRNFSVANDSFGTQELEQALAENSNMYKLRRYLNDWKPSHKG